MAEQIEAKLCRYDRLSMTNKKFPCPFDVGHMDWQPYWIKGKIFHDIYSGTVAALNVKLESYDSPIMWNEGFQFQLDRPHGLAAILD